MRLPAVRPITTFAIDVSGEAVGGIGFSSGTTSNDSPPRSDTGSASRSGARHRARKRSGSCPTMPSPSATCCGCSHCRLPTTSRSMRVLEKAGYAQEAILRASSVKFGEPRDQALVRDGESRLAPAPGVADCRSRSGVRIRDAHSSGTDTGTAGCGSRASNDHIKSISDTAIRVRDWLSILLHGQPATRRSLRLATTLQGTGFTFVAIVTLGLGIGANSAIFSVVNGVLLKPLPYPESDRLVGVYHVSEGHRVVMSGPNFIDVTRAARSLESVAASARSRKILTGEGEPVRLDLVEVSASLFSVLRVKPALGRVFNADENTPGRTHVVILSDGLVAGSVSGPIRGNRTAHSARRREHGDRRRHAARIFVSGRHQAWQPIEYDRELRLQAARVVVPGRGRASEARRDGGAVCRRSPDDRPHSREAISGRQRQRRHDDVSAARSDGDQHPPGGAGAARRGWFRSSDRVRERREPAPGSGRRPRVRNGGTHRSRRRAAVGFSVNC